MKQYEKLEIEVVTFDDLDVITGSGVDFEKTWGSEGGTSNGGDGGDFA